jgi:hypothetical protein
MASPLLLKTINNKSAALRGVIDRLLRAKTSPRYYIL